MTGATNGSSNSNLSGLARALSHSNGLANGSSGPYEPKSILVRVLTMQYLCVEAACAQPTSVTVGIET